MKKLLISLAGIFIFTGLFLIVSANNALRIPTPATVPQNQVDRSKTNILLIGYWGERWDYRDLVWDAVIAVTLNSNNGEITFKSLSCWCYGSDAEALVNETKICASQYYWLYFDYYATIDFAAFKDAMDILWWIDVYVDEPINDMEYPDDVRFFNGKLQLDRKKWWYTSFNLSAGRNHMDWETALKYVRSRQSTAGYDRDSRQLKVLQAVLDKVLASWFDISKLYNLYKIYDNKIVTDISLNDATVFLSLLKWNKTNSQQNTNSNLWWNTSTNNTVINTTEILLSNWYTEEQNDAYEFWRGYWLISAQSIDAANLNWELTRIALAKMISKFAENVLGRTANSSASCSFIDIPQDLDVKYSNWVTKACRLWIMWVNVQTFKPYDNVLRAEFWTILSRLVFWVSDWTPYYQPHLATLKSYWIMNNVDPFKIEKRGNVLLMLMRTAKKLGVFDWTYTYEANENANVEASNTTKQSGEELLLKLVEKVDTSLVNDAKSILAWKTLERNVNLSEGADLSMTRLCHSIKTGDNNVYFYWTSVPYSEKIEINLFDSKKAEYVSLWTVPMNRQFFVYPIKDTDEEILFSFIPRDAKGRERRYPVYVKKNGSTCDKVYKEVTDEVIKAEEKLWKGANVISLLLPSIEAKDDAKQKSIKELMNTYKGNSDEYIRSIGIYLWYYLDD